MSRAYKVGISSQVTYGNTVVFSDSFSSGNFTSWGSCQWSAGGTIRNDNCQTYDGTSQYSATVASIDSQHPTAARFELRDGDMPFGGTERTEIAEPPGTDVVQGDERFIVWDWKFDSTFPVPDAASSWCIPWQWHHNSSTGSPPLCIDIDTDDVMYLANNNTAGLQRTAIRSVHRGVWERWVVHALFDPSNTVGWAEVIVDGVVVLAKHARATMVPGVTSNYFKMGLYRDPVNTATAIVSVDNFQIRAP